MQSKYSCEKGWMGRNAKSLWFYLQISNTAVAAIIRGPKQHLRPTKLWYCHLFWFYDWVVHLGIPPDGSKSKARCCCQSSNIKEQATGIFHHILNSSQEEHCLSSIDQPMIVCQSNVHHWSRNNIASNDHWATDYWMHSQDSRLQNQAANFWWWDVSITIR